MTVAIFVAKNDEEFGRYRGWFAARNCQMTTAYIAESVAGNNENESCFSPNWSAQSKTFSVEYCVYTSRKNDLKVFCVKKTDVCGDGKKSVFQLFKNVLKELNKDSQGKESEVQVDPKPESRQLCELFIKLATETTSELDLKKVRFFVFIHWGGGFPLKIETEFSNVVKKWRDDVKDILTFLTFAVSSRREDCLNVNKPVIELPETCEELEDLVRRFECSSQFAKAKDLMTKYVVEAMKRKMNIKSNGDGGENSPKDGDFQEYANDLKSYFKLLQSQKIVGRNGIPMRKDWREWLDGVLDEKCNNPLCSLAYDDRGVALLSACLEEEV